MAEAGCRPWQLSSLPVLLQWCGQRRRVAGHGWLAHAGRQFLVTENDCLWNMNIGIMHPTTMPNITSTVSDPLWKKRATYSAV